MRKLIIILLILIVVLLVVIKTKNNGSEETCNGMKLSEAKEIAVAECGEIKENSFCNEGTNTWWIDLELEKEGCAPACVVNVIDKSAEINWRCSGLIQ
ncbi:MAG: hypothetical protein ISS82_05090 [Nanoarchaeota archaeon]|nr:hypothetical protein [Nanoarchaeota archaeon]